MGKLISVIMSLFFISFSRRFDPDGDLLQDSKYRVVKILFEHKSIALKKATNKNINNFSEKRSDTSLVKE